jgi:hypothetical protein
MSPENLNKAMNLLWGLQHLQSFTGKNDKDFLQPYRSFGIKRCNFNHEFALLFIQYQQCLD